MWSSLTKSANSIVKSIALIFARCGAEAGKIKRLLDENEISWGYFTDHNPYEPHCNAHPNNLIVIDPTKNQNSNILATLDFDLAFDAESFINTIAPDPEIFTDQENLEIQQKLYGTNDMEQFDAWLNSEKYELEMALGGNENMANFSYSGQENLEDTGFIAEILSTCMRDFCVKKYRESYNKKGWLWGDLNYGMDKELAKGYNEHLNDIATLIKVSICLT